MRKVLKTPQAFFVGLAVIVTLVGFYKKGSNLDLNYFLAFLLVDVWSVSLVSALFFFLISMNYASLSLVGKKPLRSLTVSHIVIQLIALIPLLYYMLEATEKGQAENVALSNTVLIISFVVFIISVVLHLINFFYALFRKNKS